MKAWNVFVLMLLFGVAIQQVAFFVPSYNNGQGLSAGTNSGITGTIANYELSQSGLIATAINQNSSAWDVITYLLTSFINVLRMVIQAFTISFLIYPVLVAVFLIPAQISAILQVIIVVIELFGIIQALRGTWINQE